MNPTQLRAFHLVAREGSFTRAAASAGVSQPNLSGQVKALEAAYGVRLFERRGRGAVITEFGRALYAVTDRLFALETEAEALLAGAETLTPGRLRISADNAAHALPIMAELRRRHPAVTFTITIGNSDRVISDLANFDADVGVTAKLPPAPRFDAIAYRDDRLVLFVPRGHEWAGRVSTGIAGIRMKELAGREMVMREAGSVTREAFDRARRAAGIELGEIMVIEGREGVREAVASGFGIGVAFEREFLHDDRFVLLPVVDTDLAVGEWVACLAERRRLSGVRAFMTIAAGLAQTGGAGPIDQKTR